MGDVAFTQTDSEGPCLGCHSAGQGSAWLSAGSRETFDKARQFPFIQKLVVGKLDDAGQLRDAAAFEPSHREGQRGLSAGVEGVPPAVWLASGCVERDQDPTWIRRCRTSHPEPAAAASSCRRTPAPGTQEMEAEMRSNDHARGFLVIALLAGASAAWACGSADSETERAASGSDAKKFFVEKVYASVDTTCKECHQTGKRGAPVFLGASGEASYTAIEGFPGLISPPSISPIVQKGVHSGPALSATQTDLVTQWLKLELDRPQARLRSRCSEEPSRRLRGLRAVHGLRALDRAEARHARGDADRERPRPVHGVPQPGPSQHVARRGQGRDVPQAARVPLRAAARRRSRHAGGLVRRHRGLTPDARQGQRGAAAAVEQSTRGLRCPRSSPRRSRPSSSRRSAT